MYKTIIALLTLVITININAETIGIRNNNPGNLTKPTGEVWLGTIGYDEQGYVIFEDVFFGTRALYKNFQTRVRRTPEMSLYKYMRDVYVQSPNGVKEAAYIAKKMNISPYTSLKDINIDELVIHVAWFESNLRLNQTWIDYVKDQFKLEGYKNVVAYND
jgi:hypothetical protein